VKLLIKPGAVSGKVKAPPSKSYSHRTLVLGALAGGETVITNFLDADDTRYTIDVLESLGVTVARRGNTITIQGCDGAFTIPPGRERVYIGNSGSTVRMAGPLAALTQGSMIFEGDAGLYRRPVDDLLYALKVLGIEARSLKNDGYPPVEVRGGKLRGGTVVVSGEVSSQHTSGLLMIAPYAERNVRIKINGHLLSRPYVDITIDIMRSFGGEVGHFKHEQFTVTSGKTYQGIAYEVEGDYSSAAFFFAMAAIGQTPITVSGLNPKSVQGDRQFLDILTKMGCQVQSAKDGITVSREKPLTGIKIDMSHYPDIVQPLAVVASFARGQTHIYNIGHLIYKETDRINNTARELRKMGVPIAVTDNTMTIDGGSPIGARVVSHSDHRMAMGLATAALFCDGETTLTGAEAISKSYPDFFHDLRRVGAQFEET